MRLGRQEFERLGGIVSTGLLLLATWLLLPRTDTQAELAPGVRVVLVDASASARRLRPGWPAWARSQLREEAQAAKGAREEMAVIVFANEVRRLLGPVEPKEVLDALDGRNAPPLVPSEGAGSDSASRLVDALRVADGLVTAPGRAPGRAVLLGAGKASDGDPNGSLARIARLARLELRPLPEPELSDLAVLTVGLPAMIEVGAPLSVEIGLLHSPGWAGPTQAFLELEVFEAGALRFLRVPLDLSLWNGVQQLNLPLGAALAGLTRVNASVRFVGAPDPIPENDFGTAVTSTRSSRVVGVLSEGGAEPPAGFPAGLERVDVSLEELPLVLPRLDALVALDVSLGEIHGRLPRGLVEAFLSDGGGWFSTGGWHFLRDWNEPEGQAGIGYLLPLEPAAPEGDPRDVILLLDGSQSMEGGPFEAVRSAAIELVEAAPPSDRVSLRFFTAVLQAPVLLKERYASLQGRAAGREAAEALLSHAVPKGDTRLMGSLEALLAQRAEDAPPALVFLLSDGRERESAVRPFLERGEELRARLLEARVRVVPIAVGEQVELKYLRMLVPEGQPVTLVQELDRLGDLFRKEVGGAWVEAEPGKSLELFDCAAPQGLAREVFGGAAPLPVERFLRAQVRKGAEAAWCDQNGLPVLALARSGRGRVAALSLSLDESWASAWMAGSPSNPDGSGWDQVAGLLRWLARRPPGAEDELPRASLVDGTLSVRGLPPSPRAQLRATLARDDSKIELKLSAPSRSAASGVSELRERVALVTAEQRALLLAGDASGTATLLVEWPVALGREENLAIPLSLGAAAEFVDTGFAPDPALFASGDIEDGDASFAQGALAGHHPKARLVLALGLTSLLFWAFLCLFRGRQRITKSA